MECSRINSDPPNMLLNWGTIINPCFTSTWWPLSDHLVTTWWPLFHHFQLPCPLQLYTYIYITEWLMIINSEPSLHKQVRGYMRPQLTSYDPETWRHSRGGPTDPLDVQISRLSATFYAASKIYWDFGPRRWRQQNGWIFGEISNGGSFSIQTGGSKAVWNLSENSFVLMASPVP